MRIPLLAAAFLLAGPASADSARGPGLAAGRLYETALGPVPENLDAVLAPDKRRLAYPMPKGDRTQVMLDGRAIGPAFAETFVPSSVTFEPSGERLAFACVRETGACTSCGPQGLWRVFVDGREGPEYDVVSRLAFNHDGTRFAYAAMRKIDDTSLWFLVADGTETLIPYEAVSKDSPAFTPVTSRLVCVAKKGGKATVVVDGREGPLHDKIIHPIPEFSPDGRHLAYVARDFEAPGGTDCVVVDGQAGPRFDFIPAQSLIFSPDSRRHAYGARRGGVVPQDSCAWVVMADGQAGPEYDQVDHLAFSPDGRHFAYKARTGGKWQLVIDGEPTPASDALLEGFPVFSPDSRRIAYGFKAGDQWKVSVRELDSTGKTAGVAVPVGEAYDGVGLLTFSPDGRHLAFGASRNKRRSVVMDGKIAPDWSGCTWDMLRSLVFSPDGKRLACEAGTKNPKSDDRWELVVDGRTMACQTLVEGSLVFSADSRHFAFKTMTGDRQRLIVDGQPGPEYKSIGQIFSASGNGFESLAVGDDLRRVLWLPQ